MLCPSPVGPTYHVGYKSSSPSLLVILSTAGLSDHQCGEGLRGLQLLKVKAERETQGDWGKGQSLVPGVLSYSSQSGL